MPEVGIYGRSNFYITHLFKTFFLDIDQFVLFCDLLLLLLPHWIQLSSQPQSKFKVTAETDFLKGRDRKTLLLMSSRVICGHILKYLVNVKPQALNRTVINGVCFLFTQLRNTMNSKQRASLLNITAKPLYQYLLYLSHIVWKHPSMWFMQIHPLESQDKLQIEYLSSSDTDHPRSTSSVASLRS